MSRRSSTPLWACGMSLALAVTIGGCGAAPSTDGSGTPAEATDAAGAEVDTSYRDISGIDLSAPSITIAYGDYDAMETFAQNIESYRDGSTVIDIDGEMGASTLSHSIVETSPDGSRRMGIQFEVEDLADGDYPADGTRVHIRGVVRTTDGSTFTIVVPAEQFEVIEGDGTAGTVGQGEAANAS